MTTINISPSHHEIREAEQRFIDVERDLRNATRALDRFAPKALGQPVGYEERRQLAKDALAFAQKEFDAVGGAEEYAHQLAERRINDPKARVSREFLEQRVELLRSELAVSLGDFQALTNVKDLTIDIAFTTWQAVIVAEASLFLPTVRLREFFCTYRGEPADTREDRELTQYARTGFHGAVEQLLARRTGLAKETADAAFNADYNRALSVVAKPGR
jgi:hypothetical protein